MIIQAFPSGPFETNAYVVACPENQQAAIIDPARNVSSLFHKFLAQHQLLPEKILLTHSHWDHIADTAAIKDKYHVPVYVHPLDALNLEKPGSDGLPCWIPIQGVKPRFFIEGWGDHHHWRIGIQSHPYPWAYPWRGLLL